MNYPLTGYHHITACAGGAQEDVNFFTQVVGLRMAKQTVLMDGSIPIYHLYYSNANLEPGSVMTNKVSQGWPLVLASMKTYLETGKGLDIWSAKKPCGS